MLWRHYLWADLGRHAGELRVGGEGSKVVHGLNQRAGGIFALLAVLLVKGSVQGLAVEGERSESVLSPTHTEGLKAISAPAHQCVSIIMTQSVL